MNENYHFYGWKSADCRPLDGKIRSRIKDPRDLYAVLLKCWSRGTCAPRLRGEWSEENPTLGQCSITAFLVQDLFGGTVYGIRRPGGNFHCYNSAGGCVFDLTSEQFGEEAKGLVYQENPEQRREEHFAKREKYERYLELRRRLKKQLEA